MNQDLDAISRQLLVEIVKGNLSAFSVLFMRFYPKVKGYIFALVNDEEISKDLAQDIFVYIWEHRDRLLEIDKIEAYIFRMASNMVLQYIRHEKVIADYVVKQSYSEKRKELLSSSDLESDIDANDMALLIWQYVETMPSRRKEIFKMSRYDGVKTDEIAEKLGISKKTVENMLSLALSDIKQYVKKNS